VGRCCVVPDDIEPAIVTKHVYRVTVERQLIHPELLVRAYQGAPTVVAALNASVRGQTRAGINGEILRTLALPIPPISEQEVILEHVRMAWALLGSTAERCAALGNALSSLDSALL